MPKILALHHHLFVLRRQIDRLAFTPTDRTIAVLSLTFDRPRPGRALRISRPAAVIGWHRRLVARYWPEPPPQPRTERPPTPIELR